MNYVTAFWNWQAAGRRLVGDKAAVLFSDIRLGDENWGTCYLYRDYKIIQIHPDLSFLNKIRTLVHEALHHLNDTPPRLERVNRKWKLTGLKADWSEPRIHAGEAAFMEELESRFAQLPRFRPNLFPICPELFERQIADRLSCIY